MNITNAITIIVFVVIFLLEMILPYRKEYSRRLRHFGRNGSLALADGITTNGVSLFISVHVFLFVKEHHWGLLNLIPVAPVLALLISFVLFDLWLYYWHRLNHRIPFLWRMHQVHHSDTQMDVTTAFRFHPIEAFLSTFFNLIFVVLIGLTMEQFIFYKLFFLCNIYIHHSNVNIPESIDRVLRLFIVTPNMHRVHHSKIKSETDSNFSSILSVWDRMYGSFKERDTQTIEYGLEDFREEKWQSVKGLFTTPFRKKGTAP